MFENFPGNNQEAEAGPELRITELDSSLQISLASLNPVQGHMPAHPKPAESCLFLARTLNGSGVLPGRAVRKDWISAGQLELGCCGFSWIFVMACEAPKGALGNPTRISHWVVLKSE